MYAQPLKTIYVDTFECPLTKKDITKAVRCKLNGKVYDRQGILDYLRHYKQTPDGYPLAHQFPESVLENVKLRLNVGWAPRIPMPCNDSSVDDEALAQTKEESLQSFKEASPSQQEEDELLKLATLLSKQSLKEEKYGCELEESDPAVEFAMSLSKQEFIEMQYNEFKKLQSTQLTAQGATPASSETSTEVKKASDFSTPNF